MLNYAAILLVAPMVLGQAEPRATTDDFTKLRGFLGAWEATDVEIDGQKTLISVSWEPILQGRFIEHKYKMVDESDRIVYCGLVIFGCDPADNKVRGWGFDHEGGFMAMELNGWDGNQSNWSSTFVGADGTTEKSEANSFEVLNKNSYGWMLTISGDKAEAVFKRSRRKKDLWPERKLSAPDELKEQLKDLEWWAGEFTIEGSDAFTRKAFVGQSSCGWVLGGNFLLYDIASVDSDREFSRYRAVIGVDPTTGKPTGWEFESTGAVGKYTVSDKGQYLVGKATSPDAGLLEFQGRLTRNATGFEYKATGDLPDAKKTAYHGVWKKRN